MKNITYGNYRHYCDVSNPNSPFNFFSKTILDAFSETSKVFKKNWRQTFKEEKKICIFLKLLYEKFA